jgi:hypothetical protein
MCRFCVTNGVPWRYFVVALIVGTILNLINQGDALFEGGHVNITKIILTYAVPYCVATYGAQALPFERLRFLIYHFSQCGDGTNCPLARSALHSPISDQWISYLPSAVAAQFVST